MKSVFISEKNFDLLLKEGRSFEEYFRFIAEQSDDAVEEKIQQAEERIENGEEPEESSGEK